MLPDPCTLSPLTYPGLSPSNPATPPPANATGTPLVFAFLII